MSAPVSRPEIIMSIIKKDLKEFLRDKLFSILTAFGLVVYILIFWLLPSTVDETITLGVHHTGLDKLMATFAEAEAEEGLEIVTFASSEELRKAVAGEVKLEQEVTIGIDFPADFLEKTLSGQKTTVQVYLDTGVPKEISRAMSSFVREIAFLLAGNELPVTEPDEKTVVLGKDRAGNQVPLREKMKPMMAFFILIMESFALSSLIATEIQSRTMTALLVTPARVGDVLAAKVIFGTLLAFVQTLILLAAVNALGGNSLPLLTIVLLGALMATGIGMIAGSAGGDFMDNMFYSMLFLIPLMLPSFAAIFPGSASGWIRIIPSYGLAQGIIGASTYGQGWSELSPYIFMVMAWTVLILGTGMLILKRKVETL